jgi:hypothetical protein
MDVLGVIQFGAQGLYVFLPWAVDKDKVVATSIMVVLGLCTLAVELAIINAEMAAVEVNTTAIVLMQEMTMLILPGVEEQEAVLTFVTFCPSLVRFGQPAMLPQHLFSVAHKLA